MAWNVDYVTDIPPHIDSDYSKVGILKWGSFTVFAFQFSVNVDTATFTLTDTEFGGYGKIFICTSPYDFQDSNAAPNNYVAWSYMNGLPIEIDLNTYGRNIYAVICPSSSDTQGIGRLNMTVGGGSGGDPYFTAVGNSAERTITVSINNYEDLEYDHFIYYAVGESTSRTYTFPSELPEVVFSQLTDDTWRIEVKYVTYDSGEFNILSPPPESAQYIWIEINSSGESWKLSDRELIEATSRFDLPYISGIASYTLYRVPIRFQETTAVTFSSSGSADMMGWLSTEDQDSWGNIVPGEPDRYIAYDDNSGSNFNFMFTYTCSGGSVYYLWFREYNDAGTHYPISISVDFESTPETWTYVQTEGFVDIISTETKSITLSPQVGQYFSVSFRDSGSVTISAPTGSNIDLFVTGGNYSYDPSDGFPYVYGGGKAQSSLSHTITVSGGPQSYIWVKGASTTTSGGVTITITLSELSDWIEVPVGNVYMGNSERSFERPIIERRTYRYDIQFLTAGKYRIRSTGSTYNHDVIAYFGTTNSGINPSTGLPIGSTTQWDDTSSGGVRDYNFDSGEITVQANITYYLWVKGVNSATTADITIIFEYISDSGKVWIYNGSSWVHATPYIYDGAGWVRVTPYVYDGSGWRKCT